MTNTSAAITSEREQEAEQEAMDALEVFGAVNLDEVVIETIKVKIRIYKEVDTLDDEGNPVLDDEGKPLKSRLPSTRTAHISSMVPMHIYNEMMAMEGKFDRSDVSKQIDAMFSTVLKIWQISEPWMTAQKLRDGVDFPAIVKLFRLFFDKAVKRMRQVGA